MKIIPLFTTAVLCLGLGVVIGRMNPAEKNASGETADEANTRTSSYRSAKRGGANYSDARRVGRIGGTPPESYVNRLAHMRSLAKKVGGNQGMPDFDALFGIWETARDMDAVDIHQALKDLKGEAMGAQEGMFVKMMLVMQLAKKNGPEAMTYAMNEKTGGFVPMKQMALQAWAGNEPEAAYSWYLENKNELSARESRQFLAGAIGGLAKKDFPAALAKAKTVDKSARRDVLSNIGVSIAENTEQRKQFTEYLLTLDDERATSAATTSILNQLALADPQAGIQYIQDWQGEGKDEMVRSFAQQWAQIDPEKTLNWQITQADKQSGVDSTFGSWARQDPASAQKWLDSQGEDLNKDKYLASAAQRTIWDEGYSEAVDWASSIQDSETQERSYRDIYSQWSRNDPEAADKWAAGLDENMRKKVVPKSVKQ